MIASWDFSSEDWDNTSLFTIIRINEADFQPQFEGSTGPVN